MKMATDLSAGIDLETTEAFALNPGERALVPTGLYVQDILRGETRPPEMKVMTPRLHLFGCKLYEIQIRPRSGLALKTGVTVLNAPGTIDADFKDEIKVLLINLGANPVAFQAGDRIAQAVVNIVVQPAHVERGGERNGGFGST